MEATAAKAAAAAAASARRAIYEAVKAEAKEQRAAPTATYALIVWKPAPVLSTAPKAARRKGEQRANGRCCDCRCAFHFISAPLPDADIPMCLHQQRQYVPGQCLDIFLSGKDFTCCRFCLDCFTSGRNRSLHFLLLIGVPIDRRPATAAAPHTESSTSSPEGQAGFLFSVSSLIRAGILSNEETSSQQHSRSCAVSVCCRHCCSRNSECLPPPCSGGPAFTAAALRVLAQGSENRRFFRYCVWQIRSTCPAGGPDGAVASSDARTFFFDFASPAAADYNCAAGCVAVPGSLTGARHRAAPVPRTTTITLSHVGLPVPAAAASSAVAVVSLCAAVTATRSFGFVAGKNPVDLAGAGGCVFQIAAARDERRRPPCSGAHAVMNHRHACSAEWWCAIIPTAACPFAVLACILFAVAAGVLCTVIAVAWHWRQLLHSWVLRLPLFHFFYVVSRALPSPLRSFVRCLSAAFAAAVCTETAAAAGLTAEVNAVKAAGRRSSGAKFSSTSFFQGSGCCGCCSRGNASQHPCRHLRVACTAHPRVWSVAALTVVGTTRLRRKHLQVRLSVCPPPQRQRNQPQQLLPFVFSQSRKRALPRFAGDFAVVVVIFHGLPAPSAFQRKISSGHGTQRCRSSSILFFATAAAATQSIHAASAFPDLPSAAGNPFPSAAVASLSPAAASHFPAAGVAFVLAAVFSSLTRAAAAAAGSYAVCSVASCLRVFCIFVTSIVSPKLDTVSTFTHSNSGRYGCTELTCSSSLCTRSSDNLLNKGSDSGRRSSTLYVNKRSSNSALYLALWNRSRYSSDGNLRSSSDSACALAFERDRPNTSWLKGSNRGQSSRRDTITDCSRNCSGSPSTPKGDLACLNRCCRTRNLTVNQKQEKSRFVLPDTLHKIPLQRAAATPVVAGTAKESTRSKARMSLSADPARGKAISAAIFTHKSEDDHREVIPLRTSAAAAAGDGVVHSRSRDVVAGILLPRPAPVTASAAGRFAAGRRSLCGCKERSTAAAAGGVPAGTELIAKEVDGYFLRALRHQLSSKLLLRHCEGELPQRVWWATQPLVTTREQQPIKAIDRDQVEVVFAQQQHRGEKPHQQRRFEKQQQQRHCMQRQQAGRRVGHPPYYPQKLQQRGREERKVAAQQQQLHHQQHARRNRADGCARRVGVDLKKTVGLLVLLLNISSALATVLSFRNVAQLSSGAAVTAASPFKAPARASPHRRPLAFLRSPTSLVPATSKKTERAAVTVAAPARGALGYATTGANPPAAAGGSPLSATREAAAPPKTALGGASAGAKLIFPTAAAPAVGAAGERERASVAGVVEGLQRLRRLPLEVFHTAAEAAASPQQMESFLRPLEPRRSLFEALQKGPLRVSIVGSGNWGSAIGKVIASNASRSYIFHDTVRMWVFEEQFEGQKLTDWINKKHENKKYLPDVALPSNLVAVPNITDACAGTDLLVFVLPHQFLEGACDDLAKANVLPPHARAISLLKGLHIDCGRPQLLSDLITKKLKISSCAALCGANVAKDVAHEEFAEATLGFARGDEDTAIIWQQLFDTPYFKLNALPDVAGVQVCGAVKNVIALAAGFCDGLGLGTNTKSAIIRIGVEEMRQFAGLFFDNVLTETFFDSAGYADLITTIFGGRNARCAAEFVRAQGRKGWEAIEMELLRGQKLQGTLTTKEVYDVLASHAVEHLFPLFRVTYEIAFKQRPPADVVGIFKSTQLRLHRSMKECTPVVLPPLMATVKQRIARLQAIVDHERYREEERKIAAEFESRHAQSGKTGDP